MESRLLFAPGRPIAGALLLALATAMVATAPAVHAQQPTSPKGKAPQKAAPAPAAGEQPQDGAPEIPPLIFSPWTRFCLKDQDQNSKQVCFIGKEGRAESGMPVVAAVLIEPEGGARKLLHVQLPLGMALNPGMR